MSDLVGVGDAIWLVWSSEDGARHVYPCKVLDIVQTTTVLAKAKLRYYQDNGYLDESDAVALRKAALGSEDAIHFKARVHLDWAYRTKPAPGEGRDFQRPGQAGQPGSSAPASTHA